MQVVRSQRAGQKPRTEDCGKSAKADYAVALNIGGLNKRVSKDHSSKTSRTGKEAIRGDRRQILRFVPALAGASLFGACSSQPAPPGSAGVGATAVTDNSVNLPPPGTGDADTVFPSSVASGDPTSTGVVLWSRLAQSAIRDDEDVLWEIAEDDQFTQRIAAGRVPVTALSATNDHTLKLDTDGLLPADRFLYYRFAHAGVSSRVGRLRTLPRANADVSQLRLLVMSCQDYTLSYFHAMGEMAQREADFVLHMGDFIYESSIVPLRPIDLPSGAQYASSREDLLTIYRTHRTDANLRALLEAHTLICTFDDHEFANDLYFDGDRPRGPDHPLDGDAQAMTQYVRDALDVWFHYLPVRVAYQPEANFPEVMAPQRSFKFGRLVEVAMTELRMHRSPHPCGEGNFGERQLVLEDGCEARHAESRTLLGAEQKQWLLDTITYSNAQWRVVGLPIPFSPISIAQVPPTVYEVDHWDGYTAERAELLHALNGTPNLVVLAADMHAFAAATLRDGYPDGAAIGTEFTTSAAAATPIASINPPANLFLQGPNILANNPHFAYWDGTRNGWLEVEFTSEACTVAVRAMQAQVPLANPSVEVARFTVPSGENGLA